VKSRGLLIAICYWNDYKYYTYKYRDVVKMEIVKLSAKGQLVIPARLRKELGLSEGDRLFIERKQEEVILKPVVKLSKLRGIDKLEGASEKIEKIRKEWDKEFENSDC